MGWTMRVQMRIEPLFINNALSQQSICRGWHRCTWYFKLPNGRS